MARKTRQQLRREKFLRVFEGRKKSKGMTDLDIIDPRGAEMRPVSFFTKDARQFTLMPPKNF